MNGNKKSIPLAVHKALEPYLNLHGEDFERIDIDGNLLSFKDKDSSSIFYFNIISHEVIQGKLTLQIEYAPYGEISVASRKLSVPSDALQQYFNQWLSLVKQYNAIQTVFDDPILLQYEKEYEDAEILDEDAAFTYFNQNQQVFIDEYLDTVIQRVKELPVSEEVQKFTEGAIDLKKTLTTKTKKETIKALNKIWARGRKIGLDFLKEIFINITANMVQQGILNLAHSSSITSLLS